MYFSRSTAVTLPLTSCYYILSDPDVDAFVRRRQSPTATTPCPIISATSDDSTALHSVHFTNPVEPYLLMRCGLRLTHYDTLWHDKP